jgi:hypothetical protein
MLPGHTPNPGGRPRSTIEQVREALLPDLPLFLERLAELTQSNNETIRLQALREILDRLLGKPPVAIDTTVAKVDIGAMYLAALKRANGVIDGGNSVNGSGAASDLTE